MADIHHDFPIRAAPARVFEAFSTPSGLDAWWTERSRGVPRLGAEYALSFGPGYEWSGKVVRCVPETEFELELVDADDDWTGTRVGVQLEPRGEGTWVRFHHTDWPAANEHYRISCNCWALYLRILRRHLEHGESVPYAGRLDA